MTVFKLGIIRETKNPPDRRVPLTPQQCRGLLDTNPELEILVQPSEGRCYSDKEYEEAGITLQEDLGACDTLIGVKEVKIPNLVQGKQYLFFSHTAKKQPYNRDLLQAVVEKGISLVDYEYLTNTDGVRVVAFGHWAGVVGAYNALRGLGERMSTLGQGGYKLKPAHQCFDLDEVHLELLKVKAAGKRFLVTGGGRVAGGALEILVEAGIREISPEEFLSYEGDQAVYTRLDPWHYTRRIDGKDFDFDHFIANPADYENVIQPFLRGADVLVACHFWDPASPIMFSREDLQKENYPLEMVADISCDIDGPIASTIKASTIADPFFGYDPATGAEKEAFSEKVLTVMSVDNLPGELPRNASADFGQALVEHVLPEIFGKRDTGMLERATIAADAKLTERYSYLQNYLEGKE